MDEDILSAIVADDEAEAFLGIEPLTSPASSTAVEGSGAERGGRAPAGPRGGGRRGAAAAALSSTSTTLVICRPLAP